VTQDANNCVSLAPGESSTFSFTSTSPYEPDQITISGDNTQSPVSTFLAFRMGAGLVFSVNAGVVKVADEQDIFITKLDWWNGVFVFPNAAIDLFNGAFNTPIIVASFGSPRDYAAAFCTDSAAGGFNNWFLPAICELGRYTGVGTDPGCGTSAKNLYTELLLNGFGNFNPDPYWSSTYAPVPNAWAQDFNLAGNMFAGGVNNFRFVRCIRSFNV